MSMQPSALDKPSIGIFWWFIAPFALLTMVFGVWPIVLAIQTSFTASSTALQANPQWVGWANYINLAADPVFIKSLVSTLIYTGVAVVSTVVLA